MVVTKFRILPRKHRRNNCGISQNGIFKIKPRDFINKVKNMLETNITKAAKFIGV